MLFYVIFQSKIKSFHVFVVVFLCIPAGWETYMTPRRQVEVRQGEGGSHRESSLLSIDCLGIIYDSQLHGFAVYSHPD